MKLELDLWRHLLNVYTKFQIDITKHLEKKRKTSKNPKHARKIAKIRKQDFFQKTELMYTNLKDLSWFEGFILICEAMN